ncbi:Pr6Pr family membrane protein [Kribbella speibonae]|uniref:Uncharacterized protein n=1 Tax=Kribbella speibonae TaxID=1572660 RepID=A0A4V2M589_9ACTN|nr:Pr6Pr family membrane protein [Kribbella speibonae]TCC38892.1 hypothetical protein E0H92_21235 [Kribbella speibonae]
MKRTLRVTAALVLAVGTICQFVQHTDRTPPLAYFTVWSALLGVVTLAIRAVRSTAVPQAIRGAAAVGSAVSGLVYAAVIAPATSDGSWFQPGDDQWVRTANVLLHGVGPVLIILDFVATRAVLRRPWRQAASWCGWPLGYLATMLVLQAAGVSSVPYSFLDTAHNTVGAVAVAVIVLTGVFVVVGRFLLALAALAARGRARPV